MRNIDGFVMGAKGKLEFFFKKIVLSAVFESWFFHGTVGKCQSGDWGQRYCSTIGFFPLFEKRRPKYSRLQEKGQEDPRIPFARGWVPGGIEEGSYSKRKKKKLRKPQHEGLGLKRNRALKNYSSITIRSRKLIESSEILRELKASKKPWLSKRQS